MFVSISWASSRPGQYHPQGTGFAVMKDAREKWLWRLMLRFCIATKAKEGAPVSDSLKGPSVTQAMCQTVRVMLKFHCRSQDLGDGGIFQGKQQAWDRVSPRQKFHMLQEWKPFKTIGAQVIPSESQDAWHGAVDVNACPALSGLALTWLFLAVPTYLLSHLSDHEKGLCLSTLGMLWYYRDSLWRGCLESQKRFWTFQVLGLLPTMGTFKVGLNTIHTTKFVLWDDHGPINGSQGWDAVVWIWNVPWCTMYSNTWSSFRGIALEGCGRKWGHLRF